MRAIEHDQHLVSLVGLWGTDLETVPQSEQTIGRSQRGNVGSGDHQHAVGHVDRHGVRLGHHRADVHDHDVEVGLQRAEDAAGGGGGDGLLLLTVLRGQQHPQPRLVHVERVLEDARRQLVGDIEQIEHAAPV